MALHKHKKPKLKSDGEITDSNGQKIQIIIKEKDPTKMWIVVVATLLISTVGGWPGCQAYIDFKNRGPKFKLIYENGMIGEVDIPVEGRLKTYTSIFCPVSIYNLGDKSLFPYRFEMLVEYDGKKTVPTLIQIQENSDFTDAFGKKLHIDELMKRDLSKTSRRIDAGNMDYGYLQFITAVPSDSIRNSKKVTYTFACTDVNGTVYKEIIPMDKYDSIMRPTPRSGISILRDSSNK